MNEIMTMLDNWKNLTFANNVIEKDYYIEGEYANLMIAVNVEKGFLFKTYTAKCPLNKQKIAEAIEKLDEKKDELI
ncbi:MAG: hypothetical protein K5899_05140 [Bacteroidaceae bacterium]|nr:hypothetical protein [Bacteroidaceae bacterium]